MISLPLILLAALLAATLVVLAFGWTAHRRLKKEFSGLRGELLDAQDEFQKEQGRANRLIGFISRLQTFGILPTGQIPHREFAEALMDAIRMVLKADQVLLFQVDQVTFDLLPSAGRGVSPEALSKLRIRVGEGVLGKAAQNMKTVIQNNPGTAADGEGFPAAPYLIVPLLTQGRCMGLLLAAKPQEGLFSPEAQELAILFASQAALILEDHGLYDDLEQLGHHIVAALARAVEAKDAYTHRHSDRTRALVRAITQEIPLPDSLIREIEYGAFLHDVGKIGIPEDILRKTDKLTPQEYDVMKKHPMIGYRILQPIAFLRQVAAIVLYHQEWYNGSGYPEGLAGEEIPLGARIVQILDAWDAMTSDRPYRKAMPKAAAVAELRRQEGTQFDPKLVELFLRVIDRLEREGIPTTETRVGSAVTADLP